MFFETFMKARTDPKFITPIKHTKTMILPKLAASNMQLVQAKH
jgi:hypothetical protein